MVLMSSAVITVAIAGALFSDCAEPVAMVTSTCASCSSDISNRSSPDSCAHKQAGISKNIPIQQCFTTICLSAKPDTSPFVRFICCSPFVVVSWQRDSARIIKDNFTCRKFIASLFRFQAWRCRNQRIDINKLPSSATLFAGYR